MDRHTTLEVERTKYSTNIPKKEQLIKMKKVQVGVLVNHVTQEDVRERRIVEKRSPQERSINKIQVSLPPNMKKNQTWTKDTMNKG